MFKIQNYKYMVYKHILNIEEVIYVSNFKINIFYFMSTLFCKYIHHIIFKNNVCTQKYFIFSHLKDVFLLVLFKTYFQFNLTIVALVIV